MSSVCTSRRNSAKKRPTAASGLIISHNCCWCSCSTSSNQFSDPKWYRENPTVSRPFCQYAPTERYTQTRRHARTAQPRQGLVAHEPPTYIPVHTRVALVDIYACMFSLPLYTTHTRAHTWEWMCVISHIPLHSCRYICSVRGCAWCPVCSFHLCCSAIIAILQSFLCRFFFRWVLGGTAAAAVAQQYSPKDRGQHRNTGHLDASQCVFHSSCQRTLGAEQRRSDTFRYPRYYFWEW